MWIFYVFFWFVFAMPLCTSVYLCLVVTCWERGDLLALICGVLLWVCHFPIGILGQVWYMIVSIPDLCTLTLVGFGWNRVKYTRLTIRHVCFIALILAWSLRRCLNSWPNGLLFKQLCQDAITNSWVSYPWASEKSMNNLVTTLVPLYLIGSSSFLHITRTTTKSWMGSKFCQIRPAGCRVSCPWASGKNSIDF